MPLGFIRKYRLEIVNFVVGAVVLTFELTASRIAAPYIGTSIYIWTSIIGVILASLALGYWLGGRLADKRKRREDIVVLLVLAAALILLVNTVKDPILELLTNNSLSLQWQAFLTSLVLFTAPTVALGMISPYLARLNITKLSTSGQKLANIDAFGTAGALAGTFLTGYVLFGYIGTRYLLVIIALVLLLTSFIMSLREFLPLRAVFLAVTILQLLSPPELGFNNVRVDMDTPYSRVTVRDVSFGFRPVRVLQMDSRYFQSGIYLDGSKELVFPYTKAFYSLAQSTPSSGELLVIGGGAFTFPDFLARSMPRSSVDVVEIDEGLVGVAKEHFNFKRPPNLKIIIADGRQYLNTNAKAYDYIFLDAFSSVEPPFQLFTKQAAERAKASLSTDGALVANVISAVRGPNAQMLFSIISTYQQVFKNVDVYQANLGYSQNQRQNLIVVASQKQLDSPLSALRLPIENIRAGQVLTDDFAPVERMTSRGI